MGNQEPIIFILVILIIPWLFVLIYIIIINRNILKNYRLLADKYGLEVNTSRRSGFFRHPVSHGQCRGIPLEICSFVKEEGRKKSRGTFISAKCVNPGGFEFIIVRKNKSNDLAYGRKASGIRDDEFNSKFIINTNNEQRMSALLNFSIKHKLLQSVNIGFKGQLSLNGSLLRYEEKELIKGSLNLLRIEILLHLLCEIADEIERSKS